MPSPCNGAVEAYQPCKEEQASGFGRFLAYESRFV